VRSLDKALDNAFHPDDLALHIEALRDGYAQERDRARKGSDHA
jgi:hypothetical protein